MVERHRAALERDSSAGDPTLDRASQGAGLRHSQAPASPPRPLDRDPTHDPAPQGAGLRRSQAPASPPRPYDRDPTHYPASQGAGLRHSPATGASPRPHDRAVTAVFGGQSRQPCLALGREGRHRGSGAHGHHPPDEELPNLARPERRLHAHERERELSRGGAGRRRRARAQSPASPPAMRGVTPNAGSSPPIFEMSSSFARGF
jgi:hypothetical protein